MQKKRQPFDLKKFSREKLLNQKNQIWVIINSYSITFIPFLAL